MSQPIPQIYSLPQLLRINREKTHLIKVPLSLDWLFGTCSAFLVTLPASKIRECVAPYDVNNALEILQSSFQTFYFNRTQEFNFSAEGYAIKNEDYYTLALELLATGIVSTASPPKDIPSSHLALRKNKYPLGLEAYRILTDDAESQWQRMEQQVKERYEKKCREVEDFTEHKHDDPDLAPAEKARVFLNALKARNKRGWLSMERAGDAIEGGIHVLVGIDHYLIFDPSVLRHAEQFFSDYRSVTVGTLMELLDRCVDVYLTDFQKEGFNPLWHAKKGRDIPFFLNHIAAIAQEIDKEDGSHFVAELE